MLDSVGSRTHREKQQPTMADISKDELRKEITAILKDADLETTSAKKVRQQIEEKLDIDLSERKKEVDDLVMEQLQEKQDGGKKKNKKDMKSDVKSEESEDGEEEEEEASEDEEEEEEEKKPSKRGPPKKSVKRSKGSSDDDESASDDDASDEEYNPKKVAKTSPKKAVGKPGKKMKKKGSDSDSDEDWEKSKKTSGGAKKGGGAGKGKGGYTKAITLSPELALLVDADKMARHEVVKKVWNIIKERNLYDPKNKQYAICDDELLKVFGVKRFRTFGMMKYLKNHFLD